MLFYVFNVERLGYTIVCDDVCNGPYFGTPDWFSKLLGALH